LPANYAFTAADAGSHTFSVTLDTAGSRTVTATDTVTNTLTAQAAVQVTPAAANHYRLTAPASVVAGTTAALTVTAVDAYGNRITTYAGTVHFSSSDHQAGLPADYTFTSADQGSHTFSVVLKTSGSRSVSVTDTLEGSVTGKAFVQVSPATLTRFSFSSPTTAVAGTASSVRVTAVDAYGNLATNYTGTVHFSSSDPQAVLPADYTFTAADQGVHTFAVTLDTAGTASVTVLDTATAAGSQAAVGVTPAAAASLALSVPAGATVGTAVRATLTAYDAYGNVATGYTGTVHFSSSDSLATLPADYTFGSGAAGQHGFAVTFGTTGLQALTVQDTLSALLSSTQQTQVS
jgi:hypothetical protein